MALVSAITGDSPKEAAAKTKIATTANRTTLFNEFVCMMCLSSNNNALNEPGTPGANKESFASAAGDSRRGVKMDRSVDQQG